MTASLAQLPGDSIDDTIRRTVRALRGAYEVDAAKLARHLGISRAALYNRLNGAAPWLAAEVGSLAEFFDCEISDFYTGNVRVKSGASGMGVTGVHTDRYSTASSAGGRSLTLVRGTGGDYRHVAARYGSSSPPSRDTGDPSVTGSSGEVNHADSA